MKFAKGKYSKRQKDWCTKYEHETTFEPLMGDYEAGHMTFAEAAKRSVDWFESWASDTYLHITDDAIPGSEWDDEETGEPRVTPRPAPHKKPPLDATK